MADRVGQRLGNYRLTRLLGKGGFAEVYLGEHLRLGTHAAVKVLYTRVANPDEVTSFEKEAQTIAHFKHPHIVRVLDFDVQEDTPFLVMDYAVGGTLRQRHPKGSILPLPTVISYIKQLAEALQYAHDQKLIHRDVKPENMLVGERDELLLSDFGIALIAQSSRYQGTQDMAGTISYMAPEQIQAHPRAASDQYSLGIVIYEWLSGDRPFHGSYSEIAVKHAVVPPPPLHEKVSTIPPDVEQVVLTALEKDPHKRFRSVQAFATALEQASRADQPRSSVLSQAPTVPNHPLQPLQAPRMDSPMLPVPSASMQAESKEDEFAEYGYTGSSIAPPVSPPIEKDVVLASGHALVCPNCSYTGTLSGAMHCSKCGTRLIPVATPPAQATTPEIPIPSPIESPVQSHMMAPLPSKIVAAAIIVPSQSRQLTSFSSTQSGSGLTQRGISRRTIVLGLGVAGLAAASGGLIWLVSSITSTNKVPIHLPTPLSTTAPVVMGTTGTATPTTGTTGNQLPTPSSFVVLKVTEVGISLKYPADWKQENPQTTANYSAVELHPQQQLGIDFVVQRFTSTTSAQVKSVNDLNQSILQPTSNDTTIHNFKLVQAVNPTPTIGGVPWAEQDASFTNSQGILFHEVSISVQHNSLYYNINYLAPDVVYAEAMQKYYSQMLASFQFLS